MNQALARALCHLPKLNTAHLQILSSTKYVPDEGFQSLAAPYGVLLEAVDATSNCIWSIYMLSALFCFHLHMTPVL
jgi:hypothetical protein